METSTGSMSTLKHLYISGTLAPSPFSSIYFSKLEQKRIFSYIPVTACIAKEGRTFENRTDTDLYSRKKGQTRTNIDTSF